MQSYEEVEKRRSYILRPRVRSSVLASVLLLGFLATTGLTFYLLVVPWTGLAPASYGLAEASAVLSAVFLFFNRLVSRRERMTPMRAALLSLTDALAFAGFLGLSAWTLVLPLLHPFPPEIVVVGVFALILTAAMAVVLRFVQPGASSREGGAYSEVEFSLKKLGEAVEQLNKRLPQGNRDVDPAVTERLASMMGEVAAMRKEFATMRSVPGAGSQPYVANPEVSGVRDAPGGVSRFSIKDVVKVVRPTAPKQAPQAPPRGTSAPESTVDNPWLDVLNRRKRKAES